MDGSLAVLRTLFAVGAGFLALFAAASLHAQSNSGDSAMTELEARLAVQEEEIRQLRERLDRQEFIPADGGGGSEIGCGDLGCVEGPTKRRVPLFAEESFQAACTDGCLEGAASGGKGGGPKTLHWYTTYDDGFVIRPFDKETHPFELKINGWGQMRHHAFSRDEETWTDSAGVTRTIRNRNSFDVERARLVLSGYALDPRLRFFIHMDGDTDGAETVDFFDYWWSWEFDESFVVQIGKRKVSASRQWLLTARNTRFVERPMANDFFRPDRTVGVWATGKIEDFTYEAMVGNGYRTANLPLDQIDDRLSFAATSYWDAFGTYGGQLVDYSCTSPAAVRFGHSFVYAPSASVAVGQPLDESDYVRLTDGTALNQIGALAPGVTVSDFDVWFYGVDAAAKWNGWSVNSEYFVRWIENIEGDGPLPDNDLLQHGYYVEGGRFLIAKKLDFNLRYSRVMGEQGNRNEYAAAMNWYPLDTSKLKLTFDVTQLDGSPVQNTTSDILAGDDGTLFRTQMQAEF